MRILAIGDSLLKGTVGVNFLRKIEAQHTDWEIQNEGANGQPLVSIEKRLKAIPNLDSYDIILLQGGHNDLLLPTFAQKGFWFAQALKSQLREGHIPVNSPEAFEASFRSVISYIQARSAAKLILITLTCFGENLTSDLNQQRQVYNSIIRRAAQDFGCGLADAAEKLDTVIAQRPANYYCLEGFLDAAFLDLIRCSYFGLADKLSEKRGQFLTIDGIHVNSKGAQIFAEEVEKQISLALTPKTRKPVMH
ncbi:MAG: SGNH/GDSL hydrolase family protein [Rufibacter sp.]